MRAFVSGFLALVLSASAALAGGNHGALPAGHPAGIKRAQLSETTVVYVLVGAAAIAGIALIASSGDDAAPANAPTTTTTTTTGTSV
jgi:hypothetical protein